MTDTIRVCSKHPAHDLDPGRNGTMATICPVCGSPIIERAIAAAPTDNVIAEPDAAKGPAPLIACSLAPTHDVSGRAFGATACPQPGCGGALIQLQCAAHPETDDLQAMARGAGTCPVCEGGLVMPTCTFDPRHSMVGRVAGQTACPICGHAITLRSYHPSLPPRPHDDRIPEVPRKGAQSERAAAFPWRVGACLALVLVAGAGWLTLGRVPAPSKPEQDQDRPGMDYDNMEVVGRFPQCQHKCAADTKCKAWTWVRPPNSQEPAHCWLKSGVPAPVSNAAAVSGVK